MSQPDPSMAPDTANRITGTPLPFSNEAEQAVLGGLMLAGDQAFDNIASQVREDDFYRAEHKIIFQSMGRLAEKNLPFDPITLCDDLSSRKVLNKAGGANYVSELAANTPSASNIEAYARIVRERATLRQLIGAASEIVSQGHNPDGVEAGDLLSEAEKRFIDIAEDRPRDEGFQAADELLRKAIDRIEELYESDGDITGVTTGFDELDEKTSGWQKADLIIVAARPSMGKTAFALNMVCLLYTSPSPRDATLSRMPSSA